jgi:hypothetical protein
LRAKFKKGIIRREKISLIKTRSMKKLIFSALIFSLAAAIFPASSARAAGASLFLSPGNSTQVIGAKFSVTLKMNTGGQSVNAGQGTINFDKNLLKVLSVSKSGSIFTLWTEEPAFSNSAGTISFGGGIPRPGYTGAAGTICLISFQALKAGTANVSFSSGSLLANDGKGTNILSGLGSASYVITPPVTAPEGEKKPPEQKPEEPKEQTTFLKPEISSETHPDQSKWYKDRYAKLSWKLPEGVNGVSVILDHNTSGQPGDVSDGVFDAKEYNLESDGVWYFRAKLKDSRGWGTVGTYKIMVDTAAPAAFTIKVEQADADNWPIIYFKTEDALSGLAGYEIFVDNFQSAPISAGADKESLELSDLAGGKHSVMVKAKDLAGNETVSSVDFEMKSSLEPKVEDYSKELSSENRFFASGTAAPGSTVILYIKKEGEDKTISYSAVVDASGNWSVVAKDKLDNGNYVFWAEGVNSKGIKSQPTPRLNFLVTPPIFARIGSYVVNYFTVFASLLFLIVLIILLFVLLFGFLRRKLKKETVEIEEVLGKHMSILKKSVGEEIANLKGADGKREMKKHLEDEIDETNRRILKEIRDVEKILK